MCHHTDVTFTTKNNNVGCYIKLCCHIILSALIWLRIHTDVTVLMKLPSVLPRVTVTTQR